jgi:hypothetical protein
MMRGMHVRIVAVALMLPIAACQGERDAAPDTTAQGASAAVPAPAAGATTGASAAAVPAGALLDPNSATREQLTAAGMPAHAADALIAGRPYADMLAVDRALAAHVPDTTARRAFYHNVWKPIDLNSASGDEMLLIPGVGTRMRHEFMEYRPYNNIEKFRREIGKYVDADEVARLERYVTIR